MKERIQEELKAIVKGLIGEDTDKVEHTLVISSNIEHGDFASNIAMKSARFFKKPPIEVANIITQKFNSQSEGIVAEVAGAGFINFKVSKDYYHRVLVNIINDETFFRSSIGKGKKVLVEFVSANPTGPLHIGHGRGAAYGDSLARIFEANGYDVTREYYINDGGVQMNNLGLSIYARAKQQLDSGYHFPENGYHGNYITEIAKVLLLEEPNLLKMEESEALKICLETGIDTISKNIDNSLKNFRVSFDNYFSEKTLYPHKVEGVLIFLKQHNFTYEKDGAVWLKSTQFGDDKDRVLKKSSGEYTYLTPDIAYHEDKLKRGYNLLINVLGADHHGYVNRIKASISALGYNPDILKIPLIQMVSLIKSGEKVNMSTRSGEFIPLDYLIDEVGVDATRYFYNMRSHDAQFDFDIDLAKSQSSDNPVYYIQYAHARVYSLLSNAKDKGHIFEIGSNLELLNTDIELQLIKNMLKLKDIIEQAALHLEPHRIGYHLQEFAGIFHSYYYANQIIDDKNKEITNARLNLALSVAKTIRYGLNLLGVSSPERM